MPPGWFLAAYQALIAQGTDVVLKVSHRGQTKGEIVAATDPGSAAARV